MTVLIAKFYPCKSRFAAVCDHKSVDPYATQRLNVFIREGGYQHFVHKNDQENSIITMFEDALELVAGTRTRGTCFLWWCGYAPPLLPSLGHALIDVEAL